MPYPVLKGNKDNSKEIEKKKRHITYQEANRDRNRKNVINTHTERGVKI